MPYTEILRTDFVRSNLTLFIEQFCLQFTDTHNFNNFDNFGRMNFDNFGQMFEAVCHAKHKDVTLYMLSHPVMQRCSYDIIVKCMCMWIRQNDMNIVRAFVRFILNNPGKEYYIRTCAYRALCAACYNQNAEMCRFVLFESDLSKYLTSQTLRSCYGLLKDVLTAEDMGRLDILLADQDKN